MPSKSLPPNSPVNIGRIKKTSIALMPVLVKVS
jgi:hypothetical protein